MSNSAVKEKKKKEKNLTLSSPLLTRKKKTFVDEISVFSINLKSI